MSREWLPSDCMFPLGDAYNYGLETAERISQSVVSGCPPEDMALISQAVALAGDGDYLELGSYWGASAILASLTKKKYGLKGDVYGVDDLTFHPEDNRTAAGIMRKAEDLGASISLIVAKTHPFPFQLQHRKFNVILIDAAHDLFSCLQDWINVKGLATKYVLFHDYSPGYAGVVSTVKVSDFIPVHISGHMAVLQNMWVGYA